MDEFGPEIHDAVKARIDAILYGGDDFSECMDNPVKWVLKGLRDPDRIFPKNQANPKRKPLPRVICGASVVDQLVTRCFFQNFTDSEGEAYPNILVSCKGIGFSDEHAQMIGRQVEAINKLYGLTAKVSDVSGWEKVFNTDIANCSGQTLRDTCENLNEVRASFERAYEWWLKSLCTCPCVTDEGLFIIFDDDSVQRSGNFLTTSSNSMGRATLAFMVGSVPRTAGDDCFEWTDKTLDELMKAYEELGLPVRDVSECNEGEIHFCSHTFYRNASGEWKAFLFSWERMMWEACHDRKLLVESDINWMNELKHHPDPDFVKSVESFLKDRRLLLGAAAEQHVRKRQEEGGRGTAETTARARC